MATRVGSPDTGGSRTVSRRGMGGAGRRFAATTEQLDSGTPVVRVMGEVDRATVQELEQTLLGGGEDLTGALIVDLTSCTFLDASGLGALITTRKRLHRSSRRLALVLSKPSVLRIFQITALDQVFEIYPSLDAAVDANHNVAEIKPQVDPARPESTRG